MKINQYILRHPVLKIFLGVGFALLFVGFLFSNAEAASSYETNVVSMTGSGVVNMMPGERKEIRVEFQNTGTAIWHNDGDGYISAYTYDPKYRRSEFDPGTWLWGDHLKRIVESEVKPGEKATMIFELHAPAKTGYYEETFHLAAEEKAWVAGGKFTVKINVQDQIVEEPEVVADDTSSNDGYGAELSVRTASKITAIAGRSIIFTAGFKNTGSKIWNSYGLYKNDLAIAAGGSNFAHPSWVGDRLAYNDTTPVRSGEMAVLSFAFVAPATNGLHTAQFNLQANGIDVPGGVIEIPVDVTGGAAQVINDPVTEEGEEAIEAVDLIAEPIIRVGVLIVDEETDEEVVITSDYSDFELRDTQGNLLAELTKGQLVTAYYAQNKYFFNVGRGLESSTYGLRFIPKTKDAVMKIANFDRRLTRGAYYADNEFRNILELRYNDYKDRTWVINELGFEYYVRGLTEIPNSWNIEAQKAQVVAARTYAFYHWARNTRRVKEHMHLVSSSSDQVYNGYGREARAANSVQAVVETNGVIAMYQDEIAITPYYARSDGRTRDWSDVWAGNVAWCKSVAVPCDQGNTQWGHGIGMPQTGAKCMADNGNSWEEIIKYFYTGVELKRRW
ncbi:MAG: SpoIID/LytB domain-containing protein [Patescibacteria group bacterium]